MQVLFAINYLIMGIPLSRSSNSKKPLAFSMLVNHLSTYPRIIFLIATMIIIISRMLGMDIVALIFTPFLTLPLIYDYHITVGKDQTLYFILSFCLIGDVIVMSDDFYYFISALMAYWVCFKQRDRRALNRIVQKTEIYSPAFSLRDLLSLIDVFYRTLP